ncbi:hypothetical protein [Nocardia camponoti]|uniref:Uncharacterized protein n=1 Tax=Nocardia camponoti TaxID=1616106 RepID=A0A917QKR7_9NOCA|nr:hypothetical protein [Nocardia camponoti]GGK55027.1 hypothetical protein GCM10011591_28680 [Nocardia camponoti]
MSTNVISELQRLEEQESTGILETADGEFHLDRGVVVAAGCQRTVGLERLLAKAGVATAEQWQRGEPNSIADRARLELLARLAVFDAAFFLLAGTSDPKFRSTSPHWLAPVCRVRPRALVREYRRRAGTPPGPWRADLVTAAPVIPAKSLCRAPVQLTGDRAAIMAAADAKRSVADIARDLGRTTYGCLVTVRELTTAGLIEPPRTRGRHARPDSLPAGLPAPLPRRARGESAAHLSRRYTVDEEAAVTRRYAPRSDAAPTPRWAPVSSDLLIRLRAALEELA